MQEFSEVKVYYMRDNHTFALIPLSTVEGMKRLHEVYQEGAHGNLFSKHPRLTDSVEGRGKDNWESFALEAVAFLLNAIALQDEIEVKLNNQSFHTRLFVCTAYLPSTDSVCYATWASDGEGKLQLLGSGKACDSCNARDIALLKEYNFKEKVVVQPSTVEQVCSYAPEYPAFATYLVGGVAYDFCIRTCGRKVDPGLPWDENVEKWKQWKRFNRFDYTEVDYWFRPTEITTPIDADHYVTLQGVTLSVCDY